MDKFRRLAMLCIPALTRGAASDSKCVMSTMSAPLTHGPTCRSTKNSTKITIDNFGRQYWAVWRVLNCECNLTGLNAGPDVGLWSPLGSLRHTLYYQGVKTMRMTT